MRPSPPIVAIVAVACLLVCGVASSALSQATVTTDRDSYQPGDIVIITGTGWSPGEDVVLTIRQDSALTFRASYTEVTDANGDITNADFVIEPGDINRPFLLEAAGQTSGQTAEAAFIDGYYIWDVSVGNQNPPTIYPGESATFSVRVLGRYDHWFIGCSRTTADLSCSGLPRDVWASFSPNPVYTSRSGSSTCSGNSTLTIHTNWRAQPGVHQITVRASRVGNPSDYATDRFYLRIEEPPNQNPHARNDRYSTDEDRRLTVAAPGVLRNDSDPDGDYPLTAKIDCYPRPYHGTASLTLDGALTYEPDPNWYGTETICYSVHDSRGGHSNPASITISVYPVNDRPTDIALAPSDVAEGQPVATVVGAFSTSDPDVGDTFTYGLVAGAGDVDNGSFTIEGDELQTNAVFDFETKNSYSIRVRSRDSGALFVEKSFTVSVTDVNEAPTADSGPDQTVLWGELVTLDGSGSSDPESNIDTYDWDSEDTGTGTGIVVTHTYGTAGSYTVTLKVTDTGGLDDEDTAIITVLSAEEAIDEVVIDPLEEIVDANPGTPLADKLEDAVDKTETAVEELNKEPPDNQAAVGNIEGAVGELEAAVSDGLDPTQATQLMDLLAGIARQLAADALDGAIVQAQCDPNVIADAQQALDDGDLLRAAGAFKDAVNKYKDALAKAESCPGGGPAAVSQQGDALPNAFALLQNHPNPFNPTTAISYDLPEATRVSLRVYDVAGRLVRVLRDGVLEQAGRRQAVWEARNETGRMVSSGVYFYRIEAGSFTETKRMVLLK